MIDPIKAISARTRMSNPIGFGAKAAYAKALQNNARGEKLNINCTETRSLTSQGKKLDILA